MRSAVTKILFVFCLLTLLLGSVPFFAYAKTPMLSQASILIEDGLKSGEGIGKSALSDEEVFMSAEEIVKAYKQTQEYKDASVDEKTLLLHNLMERLKDGGKIVSYYENDGLFGYTDIDNVEYFVASDQDALARAQGGYPVYKVDYEPSLYSFEEDGAEDAQLQALFLASVIVVPATIGVGLAFVLAKAKGKKV